MPKTKLGLPLEYKKKPEYFDALNIGDDTDAKNSVIEKLLKEHNVHEVLDLTCGTGSQVFFLTKRGYKVTGADFSPGLLQIARKRSHAEKMNISFIDGDMRTLKVGVFDAVITIFNAVGHLTKSGFEKTMRNIHKNLKSGGVYIFDILNLEAMNEKVVANFGWCVHKKVGNTNFYHVQCSILDNKNGRLVSYDHDIFQQKANKPDIVRSKFALQVYTAKELQEMLERNGFEMLNQYGLDGEKFISDKTLSILTTARKM
jgi:ubiquinone/menaquinone biosynthesis C-methylase UbiE